MPITVAGIDRLKGQLLTSGIQHQNQPLFQVINLLIDAMRQSLTDLASITSGGSGGGGGGLADGSYITAIPEPGLPNSRQLYPGFGIEIQNTPSGRMVVHSAIPLGGDGGGEGEDGPPGPPGRDGAAGTPGAQGTNAVSFMYAFDGEDGVDGLPGVTGPQGFAGATGAAGSQGSQGMPGIPGMDGEDGFDGFPGPAGTSVSGTSSINTLKKTANQTINSGAATYVDITDLTFPVVSGTDYAFYFYIVFRSAQTTTGWKASVNHPGGTVDHFTHLQTVNNGGTGLTTWQHKHNITTDEMTLLTGVPQNNQDLVCIIQGRYLCTSNGTFAARFANELAANTDLVVQKGSWGMYF